MKSIPQGIPASILETNCLESRRMSMKMVISFVSLLLLAAVTTCTFTGCTHTNDPTAYESRRPPVLEDELGGP
jgi:hypothetical protein